MKTPSPTVSEWGRRKDTLTKESLNQLMNELITEVFVEQAAPGFAWVCYKNIGVAADQTLNWMFCRSVYHVKSEIART